VESLYLQAVNGVKVVFNGAGTCSGTTNCGTNVDRNCDIRSTKKDGNTFFFSGAVASAPGGCCTANSCVAGMMPTLPFFANKGDQIRFSYNAQGGGDWYEAAIVLYKVSNQGTETMDRTRLVRGRTLGDVEETFDNIEATSNYMLRFFMGSYDMSGGTILGAQMTIFYFGVVDKS
jgi:hypothetical protein